MNIKLAIRSILKRKIISTVIILSMAICIASSVLISAFIIDEMRVDSFHTNKDRIYQLRCDDPWVKGAKIPYITQEAPGYLKNNYPEVQEYCQLSKVSIKKVEVGNQVLINNKNAIETSPTFFDIFSFPLIMGNKNDVLSASKNVVLSEEYAKKLFGNIDAVGKNIKLYINNKPNDFFVSGIFKKPKIKSHLDFDLAISNINKEYSGSYAYLLLAEKTSFESLEKKLQQDREKLPLFRKTLSVNYYLQSLTSLYFEKGKISSVFQQRSMQHLLITLGIGLLIVLIVSFNFTNLNYINTLERAKEISVRKIIGSRHSSISNIFSSELTIQVCAALFLAILAIALILPKFNKINTTQLLFSNFYNIYVGLVVLLIIGLFYLIQWVILKIKAQRISVVSNTKFLQTNTKHIGRSGIISIAQLSISTILILATIVIQKQIQFIHNKDIGLKRDIVEIRLPGGEAGKSDLFKAELLKHPSVESVSICSSSPVRAGAMVICNYLRDGQEIELSPWFFTGDRNYIDIMGIDMIEGEQFSETSNKNTCIVNETLVKYLGLENPIGEKLYFSFSANRYNEIIGVVKDFQFSSFENLVPPSMITFGEKGSNLLIDFNNEKRSNGLFALRNTWTNLFPNEPFEYESIGLQLDNKHKEQTHLIQFISAYCALSIFLSCMGLFALSLFTIKNKIKEIGVRKVNGARTIEVLSMLNMIYSKWIVISFIIACPISWYAMTKWLQNFAYKTEMSWWIFALAGGIALVIALLTVSFQSWRAARRNPVEALRYE